MIQPITFSSTQNVASLNSGFEKVINHNFNLYTIGSANRTVVPKEAVQRAIDSILERHPKFRELPVDGQINLVRLELRNIYKDMTDKEIY